MTHKPDTWFGVITEPGRELALTLSMALLIMGTTVLSILIPALGSWLFVSTGLVGAAWYRHMMKRWQTARKRA